MAKLYSSNGGTLPDYSKNNVGDLITCIKAALVTGYNDAPSAGWLMLYESLSNNEDYTHRIVVQSQAIDSEKIVFEIIDSSTTEGRIKCWSDWQFGSGVDLLKEVIINKNCWGDDVQIIASDKFVHLVINAAYMSFGDVDIFNDISNQTIIFNMQSTSSKSIAHAIASTNNPNRVRFVDMLGNEYICRSFCNDELGYGARVGFKPPPVYDIYAGGDTGAKSSGYVSNFRATELLRYDNSRYESFGFLPDLFYTDNPNTMQEAVVNMSSQTNKMTQVITDANARLIFAVDV